MPDQARSRLSPYAFVVFEEIHFANVEFFFFRAFPTLVAMRTKQQVVKCCSPTSWVGLYFRGSRLRYARRPPPKTAPQRRPNGSLIEHLGAYALSVLILYEESLTQLSSNISKFYQFAKKTNLIVLYNSSTLFKTHMFFFEPIKIIRN